MKIRGFWSTPFLLLLAGLLACGNRGIYVPSERGGDASQASQQRKADSTSARNLPSDEAAGGHTLARHVGKTDDELRNRLTHEHISAASTYTDRSTAERAVGATISANGTRIRNWQDSRGGHPNLVLDYDAPQPIGRTLHRGQVASVPCSHAVVVLKWMPPEDYYVLTSYPECK